jgi:hypothetical protein
MWEGVPFEREELHRGDALLHGDRFLWLDSAQFLSVNIDTGWPVSRDCEGENSI